MGRLCMAHDDGHSGLPSGAGHFRRVAKHLSESSTGALRRLARCAPPLHSQPSPRCHQILKSSNVQTNLNAETPPTLRCPSGSPRQSSAQFGRPVASAMKEFAFMASVVAIAILGFASTASMAGSLSVSGGGTATYSRGIEVPPGAGGLAPSVGLSYAGGSGNGPLGYGWNLQGLSAITRCGPIQAIDAKRAGVTYSATDKLCLDGMRLIQTNESGDPAVTMNAVGVPVSSQANDAQGLSASSYREFRTEKDMYARVRAYGYANGDTSGASGPAYLKIWMKSGQIFEYGASPTADPNANALITRTGAANGAMVWALARISDTAGNRIDFKYEQRTPAWGTGPTSGSPTLGREWAIREIQYSGNKVVFNYDNDTRTDRAEAYQQSTKIVSVRRLESITTYVNSANTGALGPASNAVAVKTVALQYDTGPVSRRSRVISLRECAGAPGSTRCLPAETFTYSAGGGDAYTVNPAFRNDALALTVLRNSSDTIGTIAFDINGDGKTDLLRWGDSPANNGVWFSNGDGTFNSATTTFNIGVNLMRSDGCYRAYIADVNGDGLPDIVRYRSPTNRSGAACPSSDTNHLVFMNNGNGSFTQSTLTGPTLFLGPPQTNGPMTVSTSTFFLMDVNGDGKVDIITAATPALSSDACTGCTNVYLGNGAGNFAPVTSNVNNVNLYNYDGTTSPILTDLNGDGLSDLIAWRYKGSSVQTQIWLSRGDGSFDGGIQFLCGGPMCAPYKTPIDVNGDGKPELAIVGTLQLGGDAQNYQWMSVPTVPMGTVLDLNGDGLDDMLVTSDTPSGNTLHLSNGDGTFRVSTTFNLGVGMPVQLNKSDRTYGYLVGDFSGRGSVEFLRTASAPASGDATSNLLLVKSDAMPPDLMQTMRTSTGSTTTLYYVPLGNAVPSSPSAVGGRYIHERGNPDAVVSGAIDATPPLYVVVTSVADAGVGNSTVKTEYSYVGFKASLTGRGGLGFRKVLVETVSPNGDALTTTTSYLQNHPYTGMVKGVTIFSTTLGAAPNMAPQTLVANGYCDRTNTAGPGSGYDDCTVAAKVARPYQYKSTVVAYDLASTPLSVTTAAKQFNDTGDLTREDVTTTGSVAGVSQSFVQTTVNVYDAVDTNCSAIATCGWVTGRLNRSTITRSVPNSLDAIPRSAGNSANASSTQGTGP
ncbi:FG-GAP-like repeat-containing protein [Roseateles sp. LYH14W]|uniref:FG-GAP-like repeat-containing protein n=1 Tax=Pelomonas parva TaxID=3299032 RepID=A0ABW7FE14_9BURK